MYIKAIYKWVKSVKSVKVVQNDEMTKNNKMIENRVWNNNYGSNNCILRNIIHSSPTLFLLLTFNHVDPSSQFWPILSIIYTRSHTFWHLEEKQTQNIITGSLNRQNLICSLRPPLWTRFSGSFVGFILPQGFRSYQQPKIIQLRADQKDCQLL